MGILHTKIFLEENAMIGEKNLQKFILRLKSTKKVAQAV